MQITACYPALVQHQRLGQSQILINSIPKSSGKVCYCHYKPADPCHAVALCVSKHTNGRTQPLAGGRGGRGGGEKAFSLCRNLRQFPLPKTLCVTWLRQHRTWAACSTFGRKQGRNFDMIRRGRCHQMSEESAAYRQPLQLGRLRRPSTLRMCPSGLPPTDQESRRDVRFLCECGFHVHRWMVDALRAPSGQAAAPGLSHGVPRTEPSAPCCVAADPELFKE